jgi:cation-transporting ATPase 13A3/4/5
LHRRRRRGTATEEGASDEDSKGESSDENVDSENDTDDSSESGLSSDDDEEQIARQINSAKNVNVKPAEIPDYSNIDLSNLDNRIELTEGQQRLVLEDEDMELLIEAYRFKRSQLYLYRLSCVVSLGMVWLVCRWMPNLWIRWVGERSAMSKAEWFVIEV